MQAESASDRRAGTRIVDLRVDRTVCPLGLENTRPRLSWRLESDRRQVQQASYRIRVASQLTLLERGRADLWDSGRVDSGENLEIVYGGIPPRSRQRCHWIVEVVDRAGVSAQSAPSWWEMGLLKPQDWQAKWLAVETQAMREDREYGLQWVWGAPTHERTVRRFRFPFRLAVGALTGQLIATMNDWALFAQITGIWIDGDAVIEPREFALDSFSRGLVTESDAVQVALGWLAAGEHVIAIEAGTDVLWPGMTEAGHQHALTFFMRFHREDGMTERIGPDKACRTTLEASPHWMATHFDDSRWNFAQSVSGLHQPWPAQPAMHLRQAFRIAKPVESARLYATALGAYEARLNARRVGDALLAPEPAQYDQRVRYQVYDVTESLREGPNVLGFTVADGWYASFDDRYSWGPPPRRLLAQLEITFTDGTRQSVVSGSGWRIAESAIRESQIKVGELYDARCEWVRWDDASFDASSWEAAEVAEAPSCQLTAQRAPPIRAMRVVKPVSVNQREPGVFVIDFGEHFAGWCRVRAHGARGSQLELEFAEWLTREGDLEQSWSSMGRLKSDRFILDGRASEEIFEPHFIYRGFRYVRMRGSPSSPTADSIEGVAIQSDLRTTGHFRSDVPLLESIWQMVRRTQQANHVSVPTDCASREQRGWMAEAQIFLDTGAFHLDVDAFLSQQMDNAVDAQSVLGAFPQYAPVPSMNNAWARIAGSPPGWGDGGIIIPWLLWQRYGDLSLAERHWRAMVRHLQFILDQNPDFVWRRGRGVDHGDHLSLRKITSDSAIPDTPGELVGTAYLARCAALLAQMAGALGRVNEAARLRRIFERTRGAFNCAFVTADGTVGTGSQTSYVLALHFHLLKDDLRVAAAAKLADAVRARGLSLTTGTLGTQFILDVLVDEGYSQLAYGLLLREEFPSWGYMAGQGATAIWETWSSEYPYLGQMRKGSASHPGFATVGGFLFRHVAGIDAATPGFKTIRIRPIPDPRVRHAGADFDSVMGRIATDWWQAEDESFSLSVTIPANARAHIHLPARSGQRIEAGGRELAENAEVTIRERSSRETVLEAGSGTYEFTVSDQ